MQAPPDRAGFCTEMNIHPIQSNPIFIVKTQLTERSGKLQTNIEKITLKNISNIENEKKL